MALHDLLNAASIALSGHDADALEHLLQNVQAYDTFPLDSKAANIRQQMHVLRQQVRAAERHLGVSDGAEFRQRGIVWEP